MDTKEVKRRQGRPVVGETSVGIAALVAAARRLLKDLPPARVTMSAVAREAGADAALIRYYFGSREALLLAVVEEMMAEMPSEWPPAEDGRRALVECIRQSFEFARSANSMHRLMIDELANSEQPGVLERVGEINAVVVRFYSQLLDRDGGKSLEAINPLYLHLLIVGVADFYTSAKPIVKMLIPPGSEERDTERGFEDFVIETLLNGLAKR